MLFAILLPLLAALCLWRSHKSNARRRLIGNLPTSKAQGVFVGLVELKGTAESESPLRSFLAEQECVLYRFFVSEKWQRQVTEEYVDQQGRRQTRLRTESGWTTVLQGGEDTPFYLHDDTGVVLVRPEGAEIRPLTLFSQTCGPDDPLYHAKGPPGMVAHSAGVRSFTETGIPLHHALFVVGQARERPDVVAAELAHENEAPLFLVTVESEEGVLSRMGWSTHLLNVLGLLFAGLGGWLLGKGDLAWVLAASGIYLGAWFVTWFFLVFNALVDVRNRMRQGWSAVEVQLKRRHDLIPQLAVVVDGLRSHEREAQEGLAALRAEMAPGADAPSGRVFHGVARKVRLVSEKCPQLMADGAFRQLQAQLVETEQRIALARTYFNDIATAYNTRLEIVPDGWIARLFGFARQPLLHA
ncbi:MAG: LemA family protein, partial [Verrucomicrobiales bacterium]|nr:LemA family protein [Verrucomicrobiales bacterium]